MLKGCLICAVALIGLVSLSQADPEEKVPTQTMKGTSVEPKIKDFNVKYYKVALKERRKSCDRITDPHRRQYCEGFFKALIKTCDQHLNKIVDETFEPALLEDLSYEFAYIEDEVARPLDEKTLRTNMGRYFNSGRIHWDLESSVHWIPIKVNDILNDCHIFAADYQFIKTIVKHSGRASMVSAGDQVQEVFKLYEFCRAFTKHYDPESSDTNLYSDI